MEETMKCLLAKGNPIAVRVTNGKAEELVKAGWAYCPKHVWKETGRHLFDKTWKKECGGK
jgi:hypothetical protein